MEDQLKARLIGASVLVLIAVLLIPELLSGRKPASAAAASAPGTRTYVIDLGGAVAAGARVETPAVGAAAKPLPTAPAMAQEPAPSTLERSATVDSTTSMPTVTPSQPASASAQSTSAVALPAAKPAAVLTGAGAAGTTPAKSSTPVQVAVAQPARAASANGGWAVQVGAFGSVASANKLIGDLRHDGYAAFVSPLNRGGKTLHRVRVGPEAERAAADKLSGRLKARGLPATVVAND